MVGNGVDAQDLPGYAEPQRRSAPPSCSPRWHEPASADLVLASSMVVYGDGRYDCPEHGDVPPALRREDDLAAGRFDPRCPHCDGDITWRRIGEDTPFRPRTSYAASKVAQEHYADAWCTLQGGRTIALATTTSTARACPRTRPTPVSRRSSARRSRAAKHRGCSRTAARCATSCTSTTSRWRTSWPSSRCAEHPTGVTPYNIASGHTVHDRRDGRGAGPGRRRSASPSSPASTARFDVRHVVASPDAAVDGLGFRAEVRPEVGLAQLATDPLRTR